MSVNRGVAPLDPDSEVGQIRALLGDTEFEPLDPPETGYGNYEMYSDDELQAFVDVGGSVEGGMFHAYMQMAGEAAKESRVVQDFDLRIDLTKRSADLRAIALEWRDRADVAAADIFELYPVVKGSSLRPPEAMIGEVRGGFIL